MLLNEANTYPLNISPPSSYKDKILFTLAKIAPVVIKQTAKIVDKLIYFLTPKNFVINSMYNIKVLLMVKNLINEVGFGFGVGLVIITWVLGSETTRCCQLFNSRCKGPSI